MECPFCKNTFSSKTNLNHHQKNAKYCLQLRGQNIQDKYKCTACTKVFSRSYELKRHTAICQASSLMEEYLSELNESKRRIEKHQTQLIHKDEIIDGLQDQLIEQKLIIQQLQDKLENIALNAVSRPTTSNKTQINNFVQQLQPVTDQHFSDNVQHLTIDHILKGPEGYAQYALEYPLKERMICVDYSRRKVKFKDKDGNVITDPDMTNLATKFFNSIKDKNKKLIVECSDKLKENFGDEVDTIVKIFDYKAGVDNGSDGTKTEFQHDFVKYMCSQTIKE